MDSHIAEIDPAQAIDHCGRARVSLPDEGPPLSSNFNAGPSDGVARTESDLSADPGDRHAGPAKSPFNRRRPLGGAAVLVIAAAGTAFLFSPYTTRSLSASRLRAQGQTLVADAVTPVVAPAAKVAHAPPPVAEPTPRLDPAPQPNPDQELREIIALRDRTHAAPVPDAPASAPAPVQRSDTAVSAATPAADPAAAHPAAPSSRKASGDPSKSEVGAAERPIPHPLAQPPALQPSPGGSAEHPDHPQGGPASPPLASPSVTVFETGAGPAAPNSSLSVGPVTASLDALGRPSPSVEPDPRVDAPAARAEPQADAGAPKPVSGSSARTPSSAADPVAIASELRAAPMTPADQVQVLETVARLAIVLRDVRAETAALKARVQSSTDHVDSALADFTRRLALAEARGAISAAMGASGPSPAPTAAPSAPAERQPHSAPSRSRALPVSAQSASVAAPSSAAAPAPAPRYHVTAASPGLAMLSLLDRSGGDGSQIQVSVGDQVLGFGKITAILQRGAAWTVQTDKGVIQ